MSCYAIWIDRTQVNLYEFSREKMERKVFRTSSIDGTSRNTLFQDVTEQVFSAQQILILGPGVARYHYQNFLTEHFPLIARKIIGCESVDHPGDSEIAACALNLFKI